MFKIKLKKSWLIIVVIILVIAGYYIIKAVYKNPLESYAIEKVSRGEVAQEVSETGNVEATQNINLAFKAIGKVSRINVFVGDDVKKGDILAELDSSQILAQLNSAQASLGGANIEYDKLITGATPEDIKTYQIAVDSAENDLQSSYNSALNTLDDAYTKIYNAYTVVVSVQKDNFILQDQPGVKVTESKADIALNMESARTYLDKAKASQANGDIENAVSQMSIALNNISSDLSVIRQQCNEGVYYINISAADKSSLDTHKGYINTASTNVTTARTNINADKLDLQEAKDDLALKIVAARPEDVDISKSQIQQAQANVYLYQSQLSDSRLISPINGKITELNIRAGQVISSSQSAVNLLSLEPFQIKAAVYEQDIVNVTVGNSVDINLVAFPRQTFEGKILSIDPGETIIDNVVYYQVTIEFPEQPEGIRSGMTADIVIKTNKKLDVLRVPRNAIDIIKGKALVQIANGKEVEDREIETGLEGNDYIEILSGLQEGDEIVIGRK